MPSYTALDMVARMRAEDLHTTTRVIDDWVAKGLLDHPQKRGLGRGRGTVATWPDTQLQLLRVLLMKRSEVQRVTTLCNIPVGIWLLWGDAYVPLRQVRKALWTWSEAYRKGSLARSVPTAESIAGMFDNPLASAADRGKLVEVLTMAGVRGRVDRPELEAALLRVFDPEQVGRQVGPPEARFGPGHYVDLIEQRLAAVQELKVLEDDLFRLARDLFRGSLEAYAVDQPQLAKDPEIGAWFEPTDLQQLMNTACLTLISSLGAFVVVGRRARLKGSS